MRQATGLPFYVFSRALSDNIAQTLTWKNEPTSINKLILYKGVFKDFEPELSA